MISLFLITLLRQVKQNLLKYLVVLVCVSSTSLVLVASLLYLSFYSSYDNNLVVNNSQLARIIRYDAAIKHTSATTPSALIHWLQDLSIVQQSTRFISAIGEVEANNSKSRVLKMCYAENSFVNIFNIKTYIDDKKSLTEPNTAIISASTARKYFHNEDFTSIIGKEIKRNDEVYIITNVFQDIPDNSHITMDIVFSYSSFNRFKHIQNSWKWNKAYTYVRISGNELPQKPLEVTETKNKFMFQNVNTIPYDAHLLDDFVEHHNRQVIFILALVSALILIINIYGLSVVFITDIIKSSQNCIMYKILGSSNMYFLSRLLLLSVFIISLSVLVNILVHYLIPSQYLVYFLNPISITDNSFYDFYILISIAHIALILFPSLVGFYFSTKVTKSSDKISFKSNFYHISIGLQVFLTILSISAYLFYSKQLNYIKNFDLSFNIENKVILDPTLIDVSDLDSRILLLYDDLKRLNFVRNASISSNLPGLAVSDNFKSGVEVVGNPISQKEIFTFALIDPDFFDTYEIDFLKGRSFTEQEGAKFIVINEMAERALELDMKETTLDKIISTPYGEYQIKGVVDNYIQGSLKIDPKPTIFFYDEDKWGYLSVAVNPDIAIGNVIPIIHDIWSKHFPETPFEYKLLIDEYNNQYKFDNYLFNTLMILMIYTVVLAILNLTMVASYRISSNLKNISLKKILGASNAELLVEQNKKILNTILISCVFTLPFIYILYDYLGAQFLYKVNIDSLFFVTPTSIILIITLIMLVVVYAKIQRLKIMESLRKDS